MFYISHIASNQLEPSVITDHLWFSDWLFLAERLVFIMP